MKILSVVGARPQFIKAAVVSRALQPYSGVQELMVHTGQHFDDNMSDIFFRQLEIKNPRYHLNISNLPHGAMTGRMLEQIEEIILQEKPDAVLVYGDTNSTLAGALAAKKQHIKVAHVEAGLRSFNMAMPEEINRILTDRISDWLFCPTAAAIENLKKEGVETSGSRIFLTGDVMYDAVLHAAKNIPSAHPFIKKEGLTEYLLCTIHRQENTLPVVLKKLISALNHLHRKIPVVMPVHPRTAAILKKEQLNCHFHLIEPAGYFEMMALLRHCRLALTDSGGLQKEAFFMKKICITLRNETEWVELVQNGYNLLAGTDPEKIYAATDTALTLNKSFSESFYGDGHAGEKIAALLAANTHA
jgi:UDP-GlcNAc3NAcA epimerase